MTSALLSALLFGTLAAPPRSAVSPAIADLFTAAVRAAAPASVTRVELKVEREQGLVGCEPRHVELLGRLLGSGRLVARVDGERHDARCSGFVWGEVRIYANALTTTAAVGNGESLDGKTVVQEREVRRDADFVEALEAGMVAAEPLSPGVALTVQEVRTPPQVPGSELPVELDLGDLTVETRGEAVPCERGHACARLANGKRVDGTWSQGRLKVVVP